MKKHTNLKESITTAENLQLRVIVFTKMEQNSSNVKTEKQRDSIKYDIHPVSSLTGCVKGELRLEPLLAIKRVSNLILDIKQEEYKT